jgi:uncharacterized protein (DUF2225 family)
MALESPLFLTKVECPICGTVNEFETIRVGAYTEGERQTDFCPSFIKWRNPKYQKYHPLLFFTATCANCCYTREFNNKFKEWGKDNNFRTYRLKIMKEKHLTCLADADSFVKLVGGMLDIEKYADETAILKLLLAAYDELLYDHPSYLDLGRFYLRIAWLFRQCGSDTERPPLSSMASPFLDIENSLSDLQNWTAGLGRNIEYFKGAVAGLAACDKNTGGEDPCGTVFDPAITRIEELGNQWREIVNELELTLKTAKASDDGPAPAIFSNAYYDHASFDEFLVKLGQMWDGVPRNEFDAMRFAVRYYINAFENGKEIAHGNQSIQAAYLIAELSRQIGDHDNARQYFNTTIKMGQEFINEIRGDRTRTALARKILELALKQGKKNLAEAK